MREIVLPETKPALEWVNGRVLQKVSPRRKHARAQAVFASALLTWARARGCGEVGTEWEFRIAPPGERRRPLVPDVAYLSYDRVPFENESESEIPRVSPDALVEVLSPGDRKADVEEKVCVYLAAGASVLFLVDTTKQIVTSIDCSGRHAFTLDDDLRHEALPEFSMPVRQLFDRPQPKR
jgi:Uma2 family endonuclease